MSDDETKLTDWYSVAMVFSCLALDLMCFKYTRKVSDLINLIYTL